MLFLPQLDRQGQRLAVTVFKRRHVLIVDLAGGPARQLAWDGLEVEAVALSPDGRWLAVNVPALGIRLWDLQADRPVEPAPGMSETGLVCLAFSPDGRYLAALNITPDQSAVLDVETGQIRFTLTGASPTTTGIAFSPDGKRIATVSYEDLRVWDATTGRRILIIRLPARTFFDSVAFSPDGHWLAAGGAAGVWVSDGTPLAEEALKAP